MKTIANPIRKIIPAYPNVFNHKGGCTFFSRYFPVTNLKLKIPITGAIRNETIVAKSTSSFSLFSN